MPKPVSIFLDISKWSFQDFDDYVTLVTKGEFELAFMVLHPVIVSWGYDVELDQERPDLELPFTALPDIITAVGSTLDKFYADLDTDDVTVDLTQWSMKDYYEYQEAAEKKDLVAVENFMKQVAVPADPEYDATQRLNATNGLLMRKGIEEAQKYLFRTRKSR